MNMSIQKYNFEILKFEILHVYEKRYKDEDWIKILKFNKRPDIKCIFKKVNELFSQTLIFFFLYFGDLLYFNL